MYSYRDQPESSHIHWKKTQRPHGKNPVGSEPEPCDCEDTVLLTNKSLFKESRAHFFPLTKHESELQTGVGN